jgi:L,D-transpeptidase ErfK/SrfK
VKFVKRQILSLYKGLALSPLAVSVGLSLLASGWTPSTTAAVYPLTDPNQEVVGRAFYVKSRKEDTLLDIGRQNNMGYDDMRLANQKVDLWVPKAGSDILVPESFILPDAPHQGIVLNLAEKRLYFYPSNRKEVATFAISIGRDGLNTPTGHFKVTAKVKDPTWTPTAAHHADRAKEGRPPLPAVVPAGPDNPLGQYALRTSIPSVLIHGTNKPWSMGMEVSRGCIRMYPEGVEKLFPMVSVNEPLTVIDQPYKLGWRDNELFLEVHRRPEEAPKPVHEVIPERLARSGEVNVDWDAVRRAVEGNAGIPQRVGGRQSAANRLYLDMIF